MYFDPVISKTIVAIISDQVPVPSEFHSQGLLGLLFILEAFKFPRAGARSANLTIRSETAISDTGQFKRSNYSGPDHLPLK